MIDQFNFATLVLRVAAGLMIMMHGYAHIWKKGKLAINGTGGWFSSMGMKYGVAQAWLASITELAAGAGLVVGLLTPLAAGALLGVMVVAFVIAHRNNGFFIYNPGQGWEYVAFISAVCLGIGALGAGEWSLDDAFDIHFTEWKGLLATAIIGFGGAAGLLIAFWRPPKPAAGK